MHAKTRMLLALTMAGGFMMLSACSKGTSDQTNVVEMNAMDGSMNDMTTVDSTTLDAAAAGNAAQDNGTTADNASNAN